jgi:hypothetical protein
MLKRAWVQKIEQIVGNPLIPPFFKEIEGSSD